MRRTAVLDATSFRWGTRLTTALLATLAVLPVQGASVLTGYETSYSVTLDTGIGTSIGTITNIQLIEHATSPVLGDIWSQGGPQEADGGTTTALNGFIYDYPACPCLPVAALLGGIMTDSTGQHFVLFMDNAAASLVTGASWTTAFPGIEENQLLSGFPDGSVSFFSFAFAAQTIILDSEGHPVSALFTPGDSFSVLSWSDGALIGSGTSTVTPLYSNVVPEPASGVFLAGGLGLFFAVSLIRRFKACAHVLLR